MYVFVFLYFLFYAFRIATPSGWLLQTVCDTISLFNCVSVIAVIYLAVNLTITCFFLSTGKVSTLAGGTEGFRDGVGTQAQFFHPTGLTFDHRTKVIYVTDQVRLYAAHNGHFRIATSLSSKTRLSAKTLIGKQFSVLQIKPIFPAGYSGGLFFLVEKEAFSKQGKTPRFESEGF